MHILGNSTQVIVTRNEAEVLKEREINTLSEVNLHSSCHDLAEFPLMLRQIMLLNSWELNHFSTPLLSGAYEDWTELAVGKIKFKLYSSGSFQRRDMLSVYIWGGKRLTLTRNNSDNLEKGQSSHYWVQVLVAMLLPSTDHTYSGVPSWPVPSVSLPQPLEPWSLQGTSHTLQETFFFPTFHNSWATFYNFSHLCKVIQKNFPRLWKCCISVRSNMVTISHMWLALRK